MKIIPFKVHGLKEFFIFIKGAAVFITCNDMVSVLKEYSIAKCYEAKYALQLSGIQGQLRRDRITQPQNHLA
jgi:hypothetical protein